MQRGNLFDLLSICIYFGIASIIVGTSFYETHSISTTIIVGLYCLGFFLIGPLVIKALSEYIPEKYHLLMLITGAMMITTGEGFT